MSVNPVSQSNATAGALPVHNQAPPKAQPAAAPTDTVQLSSQAKAAAAGDVDHDGDNH
jgi:hypothetical protein